MTAALTFAASEDELIGIELVHPATMAAVDLVSSDFTKPAARETWLAIKALHDDGAPISRNMVLERLQAHDVVARFQSVGGAELYVDDRIASFVTASTAPYHINSIRKSSRRRRVIDEFTKLAQAAATDVDLDELLEHASAKIEQQLRPANPVVPLVTAVDILRSESFQRPRRTFPTGLSHLDEKIAGGLKSRQQSIIAAPTGTGKTGLVGTLALGFAATRPTLWICTEL